MGVLYDKITNDLEIYLQTMMSQNVVNTSLSNCQMNMNISSLIESLSVHRRSRDVPTAAAVIQKVGLIAEENCVRLGFEWQVALYECFLNFRPSKVY